jgi:hypothetical protein
VERWFAELSPKHIRRGAHRHLAELEDAIQQFIGAMDAEPKPFVWIKTASPALHDARSILLRYINMIYFASHYYRTLEGELSRF